MDFTTASTRFLFFSFLISVCVCGGNLILIWEGGAARVEGGCEGTGREVGSGCML